MILYILTAVLFLALDAVMLPFAMKLLFTRRLGEAMCDSLMHTTTRILLTRVSAVDHSAP